MDAASFISDEPFETSYIRFDEEQYDLLLKEKIDRNLPLFTELIPHHLIAAPEIFKSPVKNYRHKCRFAIRRNELPGDGLGEVDSKLGYYLYDGGTASVAIRHYPLGAEVINRAMPKLLELVSMDEHLQSGIQAVTLLSTVFGCLCIILIYDTSIDSDEWLSSADRCRLMLSDHVFSTSASVPFEDSDCRLSFVGRSKGVKRVLGVEYVVEKFQLRDGRLLTYKQHVDGFSNPNPYVNLKCLDWLCEIFSSTFSGVDLNLLEMYCGNGNHTVAISRYFRHVVLVELNPLLCECASFNMRCNDIINVTVLPPCHSQSFAKKILKSGVYKEDDGTEYIFDAVLVDPPRAGLDKDTLKLLQRYDIIVYISCCPASLQRDLLQLSASHRVTRFAIFDQFAYTPHLECGVLLQRTK